MACRDQSRLLWSSASTFRSRGTANSRKLRIFSGTRPWPAWMMWTGAGAGSNSFSTTLSFPSATARETWYDSTCVIPTPAIAASIAASAVLMLRRQRGCHAALKCETRKRLNSDSLRWTAFETDCTEVETELYWLR